MLEMQTLLMFRHGTSIGIPALSDACRAGICPHPPEMTWPIIT